MVDSFKTRERGVSLTSSASDLSCGTSLETGLSRDILLFHKAEMEIEKRREAWKAYMAYNLRSVGNPFCITEIVPMPSQSLMRFFNNNETYKINRIDEKADVNEGRAGAMDKDLKITLRILNELMALGTPPFHFFHADAFHVSQPYTITSEFVEALRKFCSRFQLVFRVYNKNDELHPSWLAPRYAHVVFVFPKPGGFDVWENFSNVLDIGWATCW